MAAYGSWNSNLNAMGDPDSTPHSQCCQVIDLLKETGTLKRSETLI
jgi:hypothetical protein